jgi:hypothetical protein
MGTIIFQLHGNPGQLNIYILQLMLYATGDARLIILARYQSSHTDKQSQTLGCIKGSIGCRHFSSSGHEHILEAVHNDL